MAKDWFIIEHSGWCECLDEHTCMLSAVMSPVLIPRDTVLIDHVKLKIIRQYSEKKDMKGS